jgi:hypothetical protein
LIIDTTFDFRTDTPPGEDPDSHSPTLRRYHQLLWSKPLPTGPQFELDAGTPGYYLLHRSEKLGQFELSSDAVMASYTRYLDMAPIIAQFSEEEHAAFNTLGYTIGGMMVFPSNRVDRKMTINGARGFLRHTIADRMDLTLESIRRHYRGEPSPLGQTLARYAGFFALFEDFGGYVDFFLLQDLVTTGGAVRFFMPFDDFNPPARPRDAGTYREFRRLSIEFIGARNRRIDALVNQVT